MTYYYLVNYRRFDSFYLEEDLNKYCEYPILKSPTEAFSSTLSRARGPAGADFRNGCSYTHSTNLPDGFSWHGKYIPTIWNDRIGMTAISINEYDCPHCAMEEGIRLWNDPTIGPTIRALDCGGSYINTVTTV